ncbi:MAG: hypothetical protein K2F52_00855, partial [Malacoplasma sp.]|nr:hypothetical protein [Malacoplasma sp.]
MAETITNGFLIFRKDYEMFDEILGFINEHGNIFSVLALGTRKILSKNSRNLFFGCLSEFSFFSSRDIDFKMGKLKKVVILENNISITNRSPLILFNNIIYKSKIKGIPVFNELKKLVQNLVSFKKEYDDVLIIYLLFKVCKFLGIKLNLNSCTKCDSRVIFSFSNDNFGFVCKKHCFENYKILNKGLEILYLCSLKKFLVANNYEKNIKKIAVRILVDYINYHAGIN